MKLHVLGIDLAKTVFHLVGLDSTGRVVIRKRCSRTQLLAFTANLLVGSTEAMKQHGTEPVRVNSASRRSQLPGRRTPRGGVPTGGQYPGKKPLPRLTSLEKAR